MSKPYFISFDGPKGTGKSTLLQDVFHLLSRDYSVIHLVEKELDPYRAKTKELLIQFKKEPTAQTEFQIIEWMAKGRAWITDNYIRAAEGDFILMDRWYPSDAVFRKLHSVEKCCNMNRKVNVAKPDLVIAVLCPPEISMQRALRREDGLRSLVIEDIKDQIESTARFEAAALKFAWHIT